MKKYVFLAFIALFCVSSSAWAQYVKLTAEDGTISWIPISGTIDGTNIEIYNNTQKSAINKNSKGSIDLYDVWSESGGRGTHYQVTSIGYYAFYGCSNLNSITIPKSVFQINERAFDGCSGLTSITISSGVLWIGRCAFWNCSGLTSIHIPSSVCSIYDDVFYGCSGLTSIVVDPGNMTYDSRNNCNAIIETASNTLIAGCKNTMIPSSVTSIGDHAFRNCSGLTSVTIPNGVTSIGRYAFEDCRGLTSIVIPYGVTSIGEFAFGDCRGLISITIPSSVTEIGGFAFYFCSGLTSVVIPNSVTSIENYTFSYCRGLTSVVIPSSVRSIGQSAFQYCSGLESIEIPNSVTSIGWSAFGDCSSLKSVISYITNVFETDGFSRNININNATLYVPKGLADTYWATSGWDVFSKIVEMTDAESGDVNGDNIIDISDVVSLVNFILDSSTTNSSYDVNGDGNIDISDVVALVNMILGQ